MARTSQRTLEPLMVSEKKISGDKKNSVELRTKLAQRRFKETGNSTAVHIARSPTSEGIAILDDTLARKLILQEMKAEDLPPMTM